MVFLSTLIQEVTQGYLPDPLVLLFNLPHPVEHDLAVFREETVGELGRVSFAFKSVIEFLPEQEVGGSVHRVYLAGL